MFNNSFHADYQKLSKYIRYKDCTHFPSVHFPRSHSLLKIFKIRLQNFNYALNIEAKKDDFSFQIIVRQ